MASGTVSKVRNSWQAPSLGVGLVAVCLYAASAGSGAAEGEAARPDSNRRDGAPPTGSATTIPATTGMPLPRFVSLKADKVHVRLGPGSDHKIAWVFQQLGLPVEIIQETESWRRVRDSEGATGWVFHSMLSGRRTVLVLPWENRVGETKTGERNGGEAKTIQAELRSSGSASSAVVAVVEAGVLANVRRCDGTWCEVVTGQVAGYIEQKKLWGVYERESLK